MTSLTTTTVQAIVPAAVTSQKASTSNEGVPELTLGCTGTPTESVCHKPLYTR